MIICDTRMGCGVPFLEAREKNHFIRVDAHEWQLALAALEEGGKHEHHHRLASRG
jgi:transketolase